MFVLLVVLLDIKSLPVTSGSAYRRILAVPNKQAFCMMLKMMLIIIIILSKLFLLLFLSPLYCWLMPRQTIFVVVSFTIFFVLF